MKELYRSLQNRITAEESLIGRTLSAVEVRRKRKPILKYTAIAAAAACLAAVGSVPVLARNVPKFYYALYEIAPEAAERFKPLKMISESNGIRMEVGGIYFHENTVDAYVTMQDLEGDRLREWPDLDTNSTLGMDPAVVQRENGMIESSEVRYASYDADSRTLTLLLSFHMITGDIREGDRVDFTLERLLGEKVQWEGELDMIQWRPTDEAAEFCDSSEMYIYGASQEGAEMHNDEEKMLKPTEAQAIPAEGVTFTAAAYEDGILRLQLHYDDLWFYNIGGIWLEKPDGTEVGQFAELRGCKDKSERLNPPAAWKEYLFAVSEEELAECTLQGRFWRYRKMIEGDWHVSFVLPEES